MGLLIDFGCGFGAEFQWWIVVGLVWWALGCGSTVGLGQILVGLLGGSSGFAWCFLWWLCDVVVVGCVVDGGWWLLVVLLMVDQWVMVLLMIDWWVVIENFGWIGGWLCS